MGKVMLEVNNLKTKYVTRFHEDVYAVDGVSLKIEEGKSLGVAGESGCGKSTLALSLMGYYFAPLHYISGDIIVDGRKISGMKPDDVRKNILGNEIAYIPQAAMNALNPTQKIIRFVEDVIHAHDPKMPRKDIYDLAKERFQILGLPEEVLQKHAVELSGGMKQRTVIAISTILSPKVLIADEPSSALDVTSQKMVIKMMRDLMEKGFIKSMIFITHELPLLYNVTDDIMVMYAGQIVEKGTAKEMVFDPLHPYSKGLMGSIIVPEEGVREQKLTAIPGTPPNLKHPPEGCRFADRCPYAQPTCRGMKPEVIELPNGREYRCLMSERKVREVYANAFGFGDAKTVAVDHVDFDFHEGEFVSIVGESGSGKTTLSKMLLGLISVTEGEIDFQGKPRDISNGKKKKEYWKGIQAIFQDPFASYNMFKRVDSVLLDCINMRGDKSLPKEEKERLMTEACSFVNLKYAELTNKYPFELSGGQMQRLMIARIFLLKPKILLADEPTSMIDACSRATILDMLLKLRDEINMTIIFITHDIGLAYYVSDNVYIREHEKFVVAGPAEEVILHPTAAYTKRLISDVPKIYEPWDLTTV